jgi:hypothetical protein
MACHSRAVVRPSRAVGGEWDEQVANLFEDGSLTDELESALHVVAGIIAAEPNVCQQRRRQTEIVSEISSRNRKTTVRPRLP